MVVHAALAVASDTPEHLVACAHAPRHTCYLPPVPERGQSVVLHHEPLAVTCNALRDQTIGQLAFGIPASPRQECEALNTGKTGTSHDGELFVRERLRERVSDEFPRVLHLLARIADPFPLS